MNLTTDHGQSNGAAKTSSQAPNKRPEKLDNVASAWVVVTVERTRKEPEVAVLASLDAAWKGV